MGDDSEADISMNRPVVELRPFAEALHHIEQGEPEKVDPASIAAEIRVHGIAALPRAVELWLCDYLEGSIETRGRKGLSPLERRLIGRHASLCYNAIREAQKKDPNANPDAIDMYQEYAQEVSDSYSPSETAWRIVSIMLHSHQGHYKRLRNFAGAAKSKLPKSARQ